MKLIEFRKQLKQEAKLHNIDAVDIDYIIAYVLNTQRTELALIDEISKKDIKKVNAFIKKRFKHIPIDKILKRAYFYGLEFKVDRNVLTPRQDSEILIDTALDLIKCNKYNSVLDMCCGSGCLAIAIKKNANINVDAVDISHKALKIAKKNAKENGTKIKFIHSNMFKNVDKQYDLIISNPPYISSYEIQNLEEEVKNNDPRISLDGGDDGLKFYRIIHDNLKRNLNKNGLCVLEIGEGQTNDIITIFSDCKLVGKYKDYNDIIRCLVFKLKEEQC